eukprot:364325-Chlamydomonas_euryale.AAC.13
MASTASSPATATTPRGGGGVAGNLNVAAVRGLGDFRLRRGCHRLGNDVRVIRSQEKVDVARAEARRQRLGRSGKDDRSGLAVLRVLRGLPPLWALLVLGKAS